MSTLVVRGLASCLLLALTAACASIKATAESPAPPFDVDQTGEGVPLNPYHAVVRAKILAAFRGLTVHDPQPALSSMANDVHYTFDGDHALGGTRVTRAGVLRWFGRLFRLLPGPFAVRAVEVTGWPWDTRVVVTLEHRVEPPDSAPYWATATQVAELRWGVAVRIRTTVHDMATLERTLDALARKGESEAVAPQIVE